MILRQLRIVNPLICLLLTLTLFSSVNASVGDRLPEFRNCVEVCHEANCAPGKSATTIPLHHRLLFWTCSSECDYTCQHIITTRRISNSQPITQFHGKWPFYRFLGMQEPFSVLFSLLNFLAHQNGLSKIRSSIPASYSMRKYYVYLAQVGMASWIFSMVFHIRDFNATEQLDYFAAGANVLYGLYYAAIRIFRLDHDDATTRSLLRVWTALCLGMYAAHVIYLKWYDWDYTYNMAANVAIGVIQNIMWTWFSVQKYRESHRPWTMIPGLVVALVLMAMSFELLDFPPWWGCLDAHSLWHLATVGPTLIWYNFLVQDAQDDRASQRLKA